MKYTIGQLAEHFGVTVETVRRWEKEGRIKGTRTIGGHRRYSLHDLTLKPKTNAIKALCYARVSTKRKIDDLARQVAVLENFCKKNGYCYEIIRDIGSGVNYKKKGLTELIEKIQKREFDKLVISSKDRLLSLGSEIIFKMCSLDEIDVEIIDQTEYGASREELVDEVLTTIATPLAKLHGSRTLKTKEMVKKIRKCLTS